MPTCTECQTTLAKKYVRGYCIICYNRLLKNKKLSAIEKHLPDKLTNRQMQIINGLLLGDGHIERRKLTQNSKLKVERSIKDELYLFDNFKEFENICPSKPRCRKKNGVVKFINFYTRSVDLLNWFHDQWYSDRTKVLPKYIVGQLTPLTCAIWFCDDGFLYHNRATLGIKICTHSFSKPENEILCKTLNTMLKTKFIVAKIKKDSKHYFVLSGANDTAIKFMNFIKNDLPVSMNRKIIS
jgi:LAGLIDADG DNA endonuclease family